MSNQIQITQVQIHKYQYEIEGVSLDDYYNSFNMVGKPGGKLQRTGYVLQIYTDLGITGEHVGGTGADYAQLESWIHYLIGRNPLKRELLYNDVKRALRKLDRR